MPDVQFWRDPPHSETSANFRQKGRPRENCSSSSPEVAAGLWIASPRARGEAKQPAIGLLTQQWPDRARGLPRGLRNTTTGHRAIVRPDDRGGPYRAYSAFEVARRSGRPANVLRAQNNFSRWSPEGATVVLMNLHTMLALARIYSVMSSFPRCCPATTKAL